MFTVGGTIFGTDGSTALGGATVTLVNLRTAEESQKTSDPGDGSYGFDLSNTADFASGYAVGDPLLWYANKKISGMAEYFAEATGTVAGVEVKKDLTVILYIQKEKFPLALAKRDQDMRMYDPTSRAMRVVPTTPDGVRYRLMTVKEGNVWKLVLPDGTQFGRIFNGGDGYYLGMTGDFSGGETYSS